MRIAWSLIHYPLSKLLIAGSSSRGLLSIDASERNAINEAAGAGTSLRDSERSFLSPTRSERSLSFDELQGRDRFWLSQIGTEVREKYMRKEQQEKETRYERWGISVLSSLVGLLYEKSSTSHPLRCIDVRDERHTVMTVGSFLPVIWTNWLNSNATSIKGLRPSCVSLSYSFVSFEYFSTYNLIVAPLEPVPDNLKTILDPSENRT